MTHTLTDAQISDMTRLGDGWTVTDTVRSAHVLAAAVANDRWHGALSNVIRSAAQRCGMSGRALTFDDVRALAVEISTHRYGTDDADRARLSGEVHAVADYMEECAGLTPDRCPACGDPIDYCTGHGSIGDPFGAMILDAHDDGDHANCHVDGCDDAPHPVPATVSADVVITAYVQTVAPSWENNRLGMIHAVSGDLRAVCGATLAGSAVVVDTPATCPGCAVVVDYVTRRDALAGKF